MDKWAEINSLGQVSLNLIIGLYDKVDEGVSPTEVKTTKPQSTSYSQEGRLRNDIACRLRYPDRSKRFPDPEIKLEPLKIFTGSPQPYLDLVNVDTITHSFPILFPPLEVVSPESHRSSSLFLHGIRLQESVAGIKTLHLHNNISSKRRSKKGYKSKQSENQKSIEKNSSVAGCQVGSDEANNFEKVKVHKYTMGAAISEFNRHPLTAIEFLKSNGWVENTLVSIVQFLRNTPSLDKAIIGDYLGQHKEFFLAVSYANVDSRRFLK